MKKYTFLLLALFSINSYSEEVTCLVDKTDAPFVFQNETGEYAGYAIDLMSQITEKTGITCKYKEVTGIAEQLRMMSSGAADIALGSITITPSREKSVDFTHSYFSSEIGALYKDEGISTSSTIKKVVLQSVGLICALVVGFYLIGVIGHWVDGKKGIDNVHNGAWWALVTFATVGYGDVVPKTGSGKVFASIWILVSMSLLAVYTGYVSSVFVVDKIGTTIAFGDLHQKKIVSMNGTTSEALLTDSKVKAQFVNSTPEAVELLLSDKVDAIVYDRPILEYISNSQPDLKLTAGGLEVGHEQYGFVLKHNSDLRERINIAMLETLNSKDWKVIVSKYF